MISKERLARILHEEFKRDHWGDIDPHLFGMSALPAVEVVGEDDEDHILAMTTVLERVVARINAGEE